MTPTSVCALTRGRMYPLLPFLWRLPGWHPSNVSINVSFPDPPSCPASFPDPFDPENIWADSEMSAFSAMMPSQMAFSMRSARQVCL